MTNTKRCLFEFISMFCTNVNPVVCESHHVHLPSKVLVLGCLIAQHQEVVFLLRDFRILIENTLEVLRRDRINDLLVFLSAHFRV